MGRKVAHCQEWYKNQFWDYEFDMERYPTSLFVLRSSGLYVKMRLAACEGRGQILRDAMNRGAIGLAGVMMHTIATAGDVGAGRPCSVREGDVQMGLTHEF
jgi:hypothetical protein